MSADDAPAGEKPHEPTPKKLEEARKKGEIARAPDLTVALSYAGFTLALAATGPALVAHVGSGLAVLLGQADTLAPLVLAPGGRTLAGGLTARVWAAAVPALAAGVLVLIALAAQRALLMTPSKLAPKLSRISPGQIARQKFGALGLFEFAKQAGKLVAFAALLGLILWQARAQILGSVSAAPGQIAVLIGDLLLRFLLGVCLLAAAIGGLDFLVQTAAHQRKNRMTRKELLDEQKAAEGDPHLRQTRRRRAEEIARSQMMAEVPRADVVVVNPVHVAVALAWDRAAGGVPVCVAKGTGAVAERIREIAVEAGVPLRRDPPAARALFAAVEVGAAIRPDHYRAVAAAIRFADQMRAKARARPWRR